MGNYFSCLGILICLSVFGQEKNNPKMDSYRVNKIEAGSTIKMRLPDHAWEKAHVLKDFTNPWSKRSPNETVFRALHDEKNIYFRFVVKDSNVLLFYDSGSKLDVVQSDRVEIFFRRDASLKQYYCLEIDPMGRVLDYSASYYRKFDTTWTWPSEHLWIYAEQCPEGYRVDISISKQSLIDLKLLKDNRVEAGIYRGDCVKLPENQNQNAVFNWISWINPQTIDPDFHVPTSFGVFELEK